MFAISCGYCCVKQNRFIQSLISIFLPVMLDLACFVVFGHSWVLGETSMSLVRFIKNLSQDYRNH